MGGYEALLFTPDPNEPKPSMAKTASSRSMASTGRELTTAKTA